MARALQCSLMIYAMENLERTPKVCYSFRDQRLPQQNCCFASSAESAINNLTAFRLSTASSSSLSTTLIAQASWLVARLQLRASTVSREACPPTSSSTHSRSLRTESAGVLCIIQIISGVWTLYYFGRTFTGEQRHTDSLEPRPTVKLRSILRHVHSCRGGNRNGFA